jgi:hypothetical protein
MLNPFNTSDPRTYDQISSWSGVVRQAIIFHRQNVVNGGTVLGNTFHTIKKPNVAMEIKQN